MKKDFLLLHSLFMASGLNLLLEKSLQMHKSWLCGRCWSEHSRCGLMCSGRNLFSRKISCHSPLISVLLWAKHVSSVLWCCEQLHLCSPWSTVASWWFVTHIITGEYVTFSHPKAHCSCAVMYWLHVNLSYHLFTTHKVHIDHKQPPHKVAK